MLRQLTLEEVIKNIENDPTTGKHVLGEVIRMEYSLFKPWRCGGDTPDDELGEGGREERRYCVLRDRFSVTLVLKLRPNYQLGGGGQYVLLVPTCNIVLMCNSEFEISATITWLLLSSG